MFCEESSPGGCDIGAICVANLRIEVYQTPVSNTHMWQSFTTEYCALPCDEHCQKDSTNAMSRPEAKIEMCEGVPFVMWLSNFNDSGMNARINIVCER